ncbi:MAG: preprotein translocase subunit YajC [Phycisphaerae bacterium]
MRTRNTVIWMVLAALALTPALAPAQDGNTPTGEELGTADGQTPAAETDGNGDGTQVTAARDANGTTTQPAPGPQRDVSLWDQWQLPVILLAVLVIMYFLTSRARKKQEKQRKEMLSHLKKGDKIVTIGGIMGTVMDVRENEVTVKVDENNNIRMKFSRWAVRAVGEEARQENAENA